MRARIAAGLLATVVLVSGCARRAFVFPEQDQSSPQLARGQAQCVAEAKENTDSAGVVGRGLGTTLAGSVVGAIVGAGVGALMGLWIAGASSTSDPADAGRIIGGGAGVGAVIGWCVGTGLGLKASVRHAQDVVDDAFQRCMEKRGYKVGREHS